MKKDSFSLAVKKLTGRSYSTAEIRSYLYRTGFAQEEVDNCLEKLAQCGYLNDRALGERIIENCTEIKPCGRYSIIRKMEQRGLTRDVIRALISDYDETKELELALRLARNYLQKRGNPETPLWNDAPALARHLARRGFDGQIVANTLNKFQWEQTEPEKDGFQEI